MTKKQKELCSHTGCLQDGDHYYYSATTRKTEPFCDHHYHMNKSQLNNIARKALTVDKHKS